MKKVVKKHSKSHLPRAIRDLCRWKVVAVKKGDGRHVKWLPTEDCDFHPHYELWVQYPRKGANKK